MSRERSDADTGLWLAAERAVVAGDDVALAALLRDHGALLRSGPARSTWAGGLAPDYSRGDARAIIAGEHGFRSWDEFALFRDALRDPTSSIARFEAAVDAVVQGDTAALERQIGADSELVRARSARTHRATLLHYVGANGVEGFRQRTPPNAVSVARLLLDAGSDVNATAEMYGGSDTLSLVATSIHPLEAGLQNELMDLLLDRGASLDASRGGSRRPNIINSCLANGRPAAAEFLAARGAALDLEGAAGLGRPEQVSRFIESDGTLRGGATEQQKRDGFSWACEYGRTAVVEFLLNAGMGVTARLRPHGQTGLHWAAHGGHADTVRVLLRRGSPIDARDERFDGTPLDWAVHGWIEQGERSDRSSYYDVVEQLVAAGATVPAGWLSPTTAPSPLIRRLRADARMMAILSRRGR